MVTIYDIAKYTGVSKSTVSLVINNSPLVKDSTREKVLRAIEQLHYVPNSYARGLSVKATNCLGIVVMNEETPAVSYNFDQHTGICSYNISNGIISALVDTKYGVIVEQFCSQGAPGELPAVVKNRRVDGIFIVGAPYDNAMIAKLREMRFPFVLVGVDSYEKGIDSVFADPGDGVRIGMEYLVRTGHRRIVFLNSPTTFRSSHVRLAALERCCRELEADVRPDWRLFCERNNGRSAYDIFQAFWEQGNRPDAILSANAQIALGAMRYLYERHVRVPDELSVMAYEDSPISGYATPALTTVNIHKEQMGAAAASCMLNRLKEPNAEASKIVVPAELVIRDSVRSR